MSPHAVPVATRSRSRPSADLAEFAVTSNAFLPEHSPIQELPDSYYQPWESIVSRLPALLESNAIRLTVADLPVLSTARLGTEPEWRRAYSMLAFLANAHVWGGDEPDEVLPPQITIPLLEAAEHLELPPVLTFAAAALWNFSCAGDDMSRIEDLSLLFSFTGTESESWFYLISVAMEAKASGILHTMMNALAAVKTRDYQVITEALYDLCRCIQELGALLNRMYEKCDPLVFYHDIRPLLAGSRNMESAGLPRGVFYDEGDGRGEWRQLRGGSNGQSSLIQFFDVVLGVEHKGHGDTTSYHSEMREYMPGPHRRFLIHAARMGSIRELALAPQTTDEQRQLHAAFVAATRALGAFRNRHLQIVARYIIVPSRQAPSPTDPDPAVSKWRQNLASSCSAQQVDDGLRGTGARRIGGQGVLEPGSIGQAVRWHEVLYTRCLKRPGSRVLRCRGQLRIHTATPREINCCNDHRRSSAVHRRSSALNTDR
ncbi:hypothetical protein XA68_11497 [Ophiocordyceps unilateralis]|uniref:Indoleamine 2,3-dioxygenase n=1 Tax=Ophiocordyceps unilateralis TaxID=268505 RepID=A0A2A9PFB4_OPHUN|nr:hypothetical protein XA68_11497 [Ophiocordyceps unilateralis]